MVDVHRFRRTRCVVGIGIVSLSLASGCAGISPAHLGQTAGTIAGSAIVPGLGAPIGALLGLVAGLLVQNEVGKVTEKHERKTLSDQLGGASPTRSDSAEVLPQGVPTRVWVDETVQDGRLIAGHFETRPIL